VHVTSQVPFEQKAIPLAGGEHAFPHEPQLAVSVLKSRHAPLQELKPLSQPIPQLLLVQIALPLAAGGVQACPHVWQFSASFAKSTQSPLQMA
jgi:hypothetical protein